MDKIIKIVTATIIFCLQIVAAPAGSYEKSAQEYVACAGFFEDGFANQYRGTDFALPSQYRNRNSAGKSYAIENNSSHTRSKGRCHAHSVFDHDDEYLGCMIKHVNETVSWYEPSGISFAGCKGSCMRHSMIKPGKSLSKMLDDPNGNKKYKKILRSIFKNDY